MLDVNSRGNLLCVRWSSRGGVYGNFVLSAQFFSKPKIALKMELLIKNSVQ